MKKTLLYSTAILMIGALASCEDSNTLGIAQVNPQEPEMSVDGIQMILTPPAGNAVTLENAGVINLLTYSADNTVPENAEVSFEVEISGTDDFSNSVTLEMTKNGNDFGVPAQAWDEAFRKLLGKAPSAKDNYLRFSGYVTIGQQTNRLNGEGYKEFLEINVTPVDLHINVEEAYYLVGDINSWNLAEPVKFDHSDLSQYDDPVFTLAVDIPGDFETKGWWFKVVPESAFQAQNWDMLYGPEVDGDTSLSGVLFEGGGAGCLKVAGQYLFTINMLDCTYEVSQAIPMLYTPGGGNGWGFGSGWLNTWDFTNYFGFSHLNGDFKITDRPAWGGIEWGTGGEEGKIAKGAGNIPGPENGLYWMDVNIASETYTLTKVNTIGVIGGFEGNSWGSDVVSLTPSADLLIWSGDVNFTTGTEWKFRVNEDWAINLGGSPEELTKDGGNMKATEDGTFTVTLDLTVVPYTCTIVKK